MSLASRPFAIFLKDRSVQGDEFLTRGNENPDAKQYTENNDTADACIVVCSVSSTCKYMHRQRLVVRWN